MDSCEAFVMRGSGVQIPPVAQSHPSVLAFALLSGLVALFLGGVNFPKSDKRFSRLV